MSDFRHEKNYASYKMRRKIAVGLSAGAGGGGRTRTVLPPRDFEFSVDIHFTSLHVTSNHFSSLRNHAISSFQKNQSAKITV